MRFLDGALSRHKICLRFLMFLVIQAYETSLPQSFPDLRHFSWEEVFTASCQSCPCGDPQVLKDAVVACGPAS